MHYLSSEEVKFVKATEYREDNLGVTPGNNSPLRNNFKHQEIFEKYLEESCKRQDMFNEWMEILRDTMDKNLRRHDSVIKEIVKKIGEEDRLPQKTPVKEPGTFAEKVKKMQTPDYTKCLQELVSEKIKIKEVSIIKLNARCSAVLQNELLPKEKDPGGFILPCIIGNTTVSNALADLGASISVMPFSMFKRLGLGTPRPIKDNKVPIILRRPMLATAHDRIDVFRLKISLEVGTEKFVFNANEGKAPLSVCVINDFEVPGEFEEPRGLEEFLMNDDINEDLGDFLEENDLLPKIDSDTLEVLPDSDDEMGIRLEDSGEGIEIFWDAQDPKITEEINPQPRPNFLDSGT
ncbi:hypothetical protein Tco_1048360 [Tanacetum coccineum]